MKKKILKIAFISTPIISFLLLGPLIVLTSGFQAKSFFVFFVFCVTIFLIWLINYLLLINIEKVHIRIQISFVICFLLMYIVPTYFPDNKIVLINSNFSYTQYYLIRCLIGISVNSIIIIFIDLIESKEKQLILNNNIADLKYANLEAQYKLLKDQINPHFIFNSLSNLKALIKKQPEAAQQYVLILADFMRSSIDFNNKSITLIEELKLCDNYIELQKVSYREAIQYSINISAEHYNKTLPFFVLVSLLENATKHNYFSAEKPIDIKIYSEENYIVVQNNKQPNFNVFSDKTGLININERCKIVSGYEIQIIDEEDKFTVKINLL
jgi:two-component system LytT family sensor kinase